MGRTIRRMALCLMSFVLGATAQTVTGSGTSGAVPVFTGTSTVGNSTMTVSGSNVGIGTASPNAPLMVGGTSNWGLVKLISSGTNAESSIAFRSANVSDGSAGDWLLGVNLGDLSVGTFSIFNAAGAGGVNDDVFNVTTSGNVGIATTTPGAKLEVNGNVKLTSGSGASITFADGTVQSTAYTGVTCGGDYAESVDVAGTRTSYEPGDVLVIGPDSGSDVMKSNEPYSTLVTGVYSTKPGVVGRRQTTDLKTSRTEVPMAMIGIVPTKLARKTPPSSGGSAGHIVARICHERDGPQSADRSCNRQGTRES
jgi:hypothetical protein